MPSLKLAVLALMVLGCAGCVGHYSHSLSAVDGVAGRRIEVEEVDIGVLYLSVPELRVADKLAAKCRPGRLSSVETVASMRDFLFVQAYTVNARGLCSLPSASR